MKLLKKRQEIEFRWWRNDKKAIIEEHIEELKDCANERIQEMTAQGYTSGDLLETLYIPKGKGVDYSGCWDVTELD